MDCEYFVSVGCSCNVTSSVLSPLRSVLFLFFFFCFFFFFFFGVPSYILTSASLKIHKDNLYNKLYPVTIWITEDMLYIGRTKMVYMQIGQILLPCIE